MNEQTETVQQIVAKKQPVLSRSEREEVSKESFSAFSVRLTTDPVGKKKLSNSLVITVPDTRSESVIKLTLRESYALQAFLNKNLPTKTK